MNRFLLIILFGFIIASCVPNKKLVYLQSEGELKEDFPKDSVIRSYKLANYEYEIQPEDILSIRFESLTDDDYNVFAGQQTAATGGGQNNLALAGYLVDKNGNIVFAEIGEVKVAGMTLHQVETELQKLAFKYVQSPAVKVRLLNFRITILGEVNKEGVVTSLDNRITLLEAIARAGGVSELADRENIKLIRQNDGQSEVLYINLLDENSMIYESFYAHQNDIIIVPPLRQRPFRKYFGQNLGLFLSAVSTLLLVINLTAK